MQYMRSEEHTSELQSLRHLVCRLLLEKKKPNRCDVPRHVEGDRSGCDALRERRSSLHTRPDRQQPWFCPWCCLFLVFFFFFFNDRAPPEISPFPLPAPFPI